MEIAIIHNEKRVDRFKLLQQELMEQEILEYKIFPAIFMEKPKMGINKAHKNVVEFARDNNLEEICVWEDDCHWVTTNAFKFFIYNKPKDYDIYLSSIMWGRINGENIVEDYAGNQCYVVHQRFYDTFLSADPNRDIDRAMARKGKFIVVNPFCTVQHETFSDNTKKIHLNKKHYHGRTFYNG